MRMQMLAAFLPGMMLAGCGGSDGDLTASVSSDGTIYVGSYNHRLYAFRNDGHVLWRSKTDKFVFSSPTICSDGIVSVKSSV